MFKLSITRDFIAQHYLIGGDWGAENDLHSHHYQLEIQVAGKELDQFGYLVDIVELENVTSSIIDEYRDKTLNDLTPFKDLNPSLERFARIIYFALTERLDFRQLHFTVKLWENEKDWASFSG